MQLQADLLGCPVLRNRSTDLSAMGAAWLAGLAVGVWKSADELERLPRTMDRFEPRMSERDRERLYAGWREAVERARQRRSSP
jgi:glycerol kinase